MKINGYLVMRLWILFSRFSDATAILIEDVLLKTVCDTPESQKECAFNNHV